MTDKRKERIAIDLLYTGGRDEPGQGIFRNHPVPPELASNLMIAVRELEDKTNFPENPKQFQVHLIGTAQSLESLGTYLIALARLDTDDPEPYGSFDDVRNADGGTVRLLPRRVDEMLPS